MDAIKWKLNDRSWNVPLPPQLRIKRKQVHPPATKKSELTENNRAVFKEIRRAIRNSTSAKTYAFGSRVRGTFIPESDYDVAIIGNAMDFSLAKKSVEKLPYKVDLHNITIPIENSILL